jgi:hypothetical protein
VSHLGYIFSSIAFREDLTPADCTYLADTGWPTGGLVSWDGLH